MDEIKALEKLRAAGRNMAKGRNLENHEECNLLLVIADEIEAEIAEKFVELPCDIEGVPIHVGDSIEFPNGIRDVVRFITINDNEPTFNESGWIPGKCRHYKPRTVEDVLREFAECVRDERGGQLDDGDIEGFADEIRGLL